MPDLATSQEQALQGTRTAGVHPGSLASASVMTLLIFLAVPYLDLASSRANPDYLLLPADTVLPPVQHPPPELPRTQAAEEPRPEPVPMRAKRPRIPVSSSLNLELVLGGTAGDFDLAFPVALPGTAVSMDSTIFDIRDVQTAPIPVFRMQPYYPRSARIRKLEGEVEVTFVVNTDGTTSQVRITTPGADPLFSRSAMRAVRNWRFQPGSVDGHAVPVRVRQKLTFRLNTR